MATKKLLAIRFGVALALLLILVTGCKSEVASNSTTSIRLPNLPNWEAPSGAAKLVFSTEPAEATAGLTFTRQPVVKIVDSSGNTVTNAAAPVTLFIISSSLDGTLLGTTTVRTVDGVATFSDLSIDVAAFDYTLAASSPGLTPIVSNSFNVVPGAAAILIFGTQPDDETLGTDWTTQPEVEIDDSYGNMVTDATNPVTLAIVPNTGTAGAVLSGQTKVNAVNGVATFAGLSINPAGNGYKITATSNGLASVISNSFNVQ